MALPVISAARAGDIPFGLAGTVYLVQVAVGLIIFATFQQFVPDALDTGDALPGILVTVYGAARFLFETPSGAITDRIERKRGMLLGFIIMGASVALMAFVREPAAYLAFSALLGIGNAFLWPATYAISADMYPPSKRGQASGYLNVAQLLGYGTGGLAGALVVESLPTLQFVICAIALLLAFFLVVRVVPGYRGGTAPGEQRPSIWSIMSVKIGLMAALVLGASSSSAMLIPAIRPFGEDQLGVSFATVTLALGPALIIGAAAYVPAGRLADRYGRAYPFVAGQLLVATGLIGLSMVTRVELGAVLAIFVFSGFTMSIPAWSSAVMDLAPLSHRGSIIGLTVAMSGAGLAVGPAIGGVVTELQDAVMTLRTAAALSLATGFGIFVYWKLYGDGRAVDTGQQPGTTAERQRP